MTRCLIVLTLALAASIAQAAEAPDPWSLAALAKAKQAFPASAELVEQGRALYAKHCAGCHGDEGKGDGASADLLLPRPRDFTNAAMYKFRSTRSGELPTDEDLHRVIGRGLPGTAMPAWGEGRFKLDEGARWALTYYLKTFAPDDFEDDDFSPYRTDDEGPAIVPAPAPPGATPERIEAGRALFLDEKKGACVKCHGPNGRGNGGEAGTQRDDRGSPILPIDQTNPREYRNGTRVEDIFRTFSTGINGTPMPGYAQLLSEEERWQLSYYVRSTIEATQPATGEVLRAVEGPIPGDPFDLEWLVMPPWRVPLLGQLVVRPRHHNPSVDQVWVRARVDGDVLAIHLMWNDRSEDRAHQASLEAGDLGVNDEVPAVAALKGTFATVSEIWARRKGPHRDSIQLQFPAEAVAGAEKPFFYLGGGAGPVNLWRWYADRDGEGGEGEPGRAFEESVQSGPGSRAATQDEGDQGLAGQAVFRDGRWAVVFRRALRTSGPRDVQFEPGAFVPFALQVWDGGNGEEGRLCAISSWHSMRVGRGRVEAAYLTGLGWGLAALLLAWLAVRRARAAPPETPEGDG